MSTDSRDYFITKYKALEDLPNVGPATAKQLRDGGFKTVQGVATATIRELINAGVGEETSKKIIAAARKTLAVEFVTASELAKRRASLKQLTTGAHTLDMLFNGGLETQSITEFYGEFGCHSEDTMVLTPEGVEEWCSKEVGDIILGMKDGLIVESEILEKFEYDFDGELNELSTNRFNLCITDKHTVYYKTIQAKSNGKGYSLIPFDEVGKSGYLQSTFDFKGEKITKFNIQRYIQLPKTLYPQKSRAKELLKPMDVNDFLELTGYYVADGSPLRSEYANYPTIRNGRKIKELEELVRRLSLDYSIYEGSKIVIFHRDLGEYMLRCGEGAENKTIPPELRNLDKKHLGYLFKGLMACDAHHNGYTYYTSSKKLRDQFLILTLKLGLNTSYREASMNEHQLSDGRIITPRHQPYYINISYNPKGHFNSNSNLSKVRYRGTIWCFKTTTGNFFTVRQGQPTLSGNSGKSQICQQLCVTVQLPEEQGGLNGSALYVDTEHTFRPERVVEMSKRFELDPKDVLNQIVFAEAYTSDHQMGLLESCDEVIKDNNVRLIIIDSVTGHFRHEYIGRENLPTRQQKLNQHLHKLLKLCRAFDAVGVVTNQVVSTPDTFAKGANTPKAIGGNIMGHTAHSRIYLHKGRSNLRIAKITASPFLPEGEVPIRITHEGIVPSEPTE